ncbi:MAG TPA: hypothetical protein VMH87_17790 [Pseudomonadales bacterium]|nr:hypothetical protein [Pseudomonadales bacterium]
MNTDNKPTDAEVKIAIKQILSESLLSIRLQGALGNHKNCEIEADHVHNLPVLLINFSDELLAFYYNVERKAYLAQSGGKYPLTYDAHWKVLAMRLGLTQS